MSVGNEIFDCISLNAAACCGPFPLHGSQHTSGIPDSRCVDTDGIEFHCSHGTLGEELSYGETATQRNRSRRAFLSCSNFCPRMPVMMESSTYAATRAYVVPRFSVEKHKTVGSVPCSPSSHQRQEHGQQRATNFVVHFQVHTLLSRVSPPTPKGC